MYSDLFYGTKGPRHAKYLVVGEAYGSMEHRLNKPFVGASGTELDKLFFEAGIPLNECLYTNVINRQPLGNDIKKFFYKTKEAKDSGYYPVRGLYPRPEIMQSLARLEKIIETVKPEKIIALGNYPLWALTENNFSISNTEGYKTPSGILQWRGSQLEYRNSQIPVMPTIHPAAMLRNWPYRYLMKHDLAWRLKKSWTPPDYRFTIRPTFAQVMEAIKELLARCEKEETPCSVDLEIKHKTIACVGLGWSTIDAICIPFQCQDNPEGYWTWEEEYPLILKLRELISHPNFKIIGQNFLFDSQYFARDMAVVPYIAYDTMIMQHLLYPGTNLRLWHLASLYCQYYKFWKDELKEFYLAGGDDIGWEYNCKDCVNTFEIWKTLQFLIERAGLQEQWKVQRDQLQLFLKMMLRGVNIDTAKREQVAAELANTKLLMEQELENYIPESIYERDPKKSAYYRSSQQLCYIFYDLLKITPEIDRKTGSRTVNDEALTSLGKKEPLIKPFVQQLAEYRSLCKFEEFATQDLDTDQRMRCSYTPTAETFRSKSSQNVFGSGGNLQNLPKGTEDEEDLVQV